jgi:hypothetical protein
MILTHIPKLLAADGESYRHMIGAVAMIYIGRIHVTPTDVFIIPCKGLSRFHIGKLTNAWPALQRRDVWTDHPGGGMETHVSVRA